jgi:transcriptional regulator with XRE-family HTH domain
LPQPIPALAELKHLRKCFGMTIGEVATRIGYARGTISEVENGNRSPSLRMIMDYASIFDLEFRLCPASLKHTPLTSKDWTIGPEAKSTTDSTVA